MVIPEGDESETDEMGSDIEDEVAMFAIDPLPDEVHEYFSETNEAEVETPAKRAKKEMKVGLNALKAYQKRKLTISGKRFKPKSRYMTTQR